MADAEADSAHHNGREPVRRSMDELARRELQAWAAKSNGGANGAASLWPEREARELVDAIVAGAYGDDLGRVERAARTWARTNGSLGVFARRLGVLRASFGASVPVEDDPPAARLGPVLDSVARAATAEWLSVLGLAHAAPYGELRTVEPRSTRLTLRRIFEDRRPWREAGVALLAGVAAGAVVMALVAAPSPPRGHLQAHELGSQPSPAVRPPAGGRKPRAVSLALARRPATGGPASGRAVRTLSGSDEGPVEAGSGSSPPGGGSSPVPVPGSGPGGVPLPVPLPLPAVPTPPVVPVSVTGVGPAGAPTPVS